MKKPRHIEIPENRCISYKDYIDFSEHAYNSALWYATTYNKSVGKIKEKLYAKGYVEGDIIVEKLNGETFKKDIVTDTIKRLETNLIVDDEHYAESFVRSKIAAGQGLSVIRMKLLQEKVPIEIIDKTLKKYEESEELDEGIKKAFKRIVEQSSFQKLDIFKQKQKIFRTLASKGFDMSNISKITNQYFEDHDG